MKCIPNFFIVGAPKCGTTALSEYLREHPNVFMSSPKEPHYFASDMINHRAISSGDDYLSLFKDVSDSHSAVGEASVWYLYSTQAIKNIYQFNKDAKIIVMLRKPVDMVHSMHSQAFYSLGEDVEDFESAWDLEPVRKLGFSIPKYNLHREILYYSEIAKYHKQLINIYEFFPKNQVKVILFDDFKKDTKSVYDDVQVFLNISHIEKYNFEVINQNAHSNLKFLRKLLKNESEFVKSIRVNIKNILGIKNIGFRQFIDKSTSTAKKRESLNPIIRKRVIEHYKPDVEKLSELIGRDLSEWNN